MKLEGFACLIRVCDMGILEDDDNGGFLRVVGMMLVQSERGFLFGLKDGFLSASIVVRICDFCELK